MAVDGAEALRHGDRRLVMLNAKGVYSDRLRAEGVTVEQTNPRDAQAWKTSDFITKPGAVAALKDAHCVAVTLVGSAENPGNNEQRQGMKVWEKVAGTRALLDRPTALAWTEDGRWLWAQHDRVSRLTMKANSPLKSVCELKGVRSLALSPDGKWRACSAGGELFAVSTATRGKNHGVKKRMELKTIPSWA